MTVVGFFFMPQTALQICNSALIKIGGRTVPTYGNTDTKEGELVAEAFPRILGYMTRNHVWGFLKKIATLTSATATTVVPWSWIHDLPTDLGRILSVVDASDVHVHYEIIGSTIYTADNPVVLRYIRLIPSENFVAIAYDAGPPEVAAEAAFQFPDDFAEACACLLAADICVSLTQNSDMRAEMLQMYEGHLRTARFNGAVERSLVTIEADDWIATRGTYGDLNSYPDKLA